MVTLREIAQRASSGSVILVEEMTPPRAGAKPRSVALGGTALPFKGADWPGEQRMTTTFYTGNREGSQQTLGPTLGPSSWEGAWHRTMLGRHPVTYVDDQGVEQRVVAPMRLREIFESIGQGGALLRVTWMSASTTFVGGDDKTERYDQHKVVRMGRLQKWSFPIDTEMDVKWSFTFAWVGVGADPKVVARRDDMDFQASADALSASNEALRELIDARIRTVAGSRVPKVASKLTLGKLEAIAKTPQTLAAGLARNLQRNVSQARAVADVALVARAAPFAAANTVVDFARNTVNLTKVYVDTFGRQPAEATVLKPKVRAMVRSYKYLVDIAESARQASSRAQDVDDAVRRVVAASANGGNVAVKDSSSTRAGEILAVHVCREGDTPQRLSTRYYGNPDNGAAILKSNRLPLHTPAFERGRVLIIPTLPNAAGQGT